VNLIEKDVQPVVTHLYVYPIKSCRGIEVSECELTPNGFKQDRQ
jgi:uncharacterized protein YcbX